MKNYLDLFAREYILFLSAF